MAYQTFAIQPEQTTPRFIGRLMDVDFFRMSFFSLYMWGVVNSCSSRKPTQGPLIKSHVGRSIHFLATQNQQESTNNLHKSCAHGELFEMLETLAMFRSIQPQSQSDFRHSASVKRLKTLWRLGELLHFPREQNRHSQSGVPRSEFCRCLNSRWRFGF